MQPEGDLPILLFRSDAGPEIGTGHVMRCLALAQAWQSVGGTGVFLSQCASVSLRQQIESSGVGFIPLEASYPHPSDPATTLEVLSRLTGDRSAWVVLDGYHFDVRYQTSIRASGCRLLVIDDTNHLPEYDADILLNQNVGAENLSYNCPPETVLLRGPSNVLLRHEFWGRGGVPRAQPDLAQKILVTMGGGDPGNMTLRALQALESAELGDLEVVAVIGASNPHYESVATNACKSKVPIRLVRNATNMPELMAWADVAVSAAGSTTWELAYMGVPEVLVVLAENQRAIAEGLHDAGVAVNLGSAHQVTEHQIVGTIRRILHNSDVRREMSSRGISMVDGRGATRICQSIITSGG
jgi:UDP-2,4-diacetamido-2,4,6-trideoxy-beta-L-altropyranose hydrolase